MTIDRQSGDPLPESFAPLDCRAEFDLAEWLAGIPLDVTSLTRGVREISRTVGDEAIAIVNARGFGARAPLRDVMAAYAEIARVCMPHYPLLEAIRRLGWEVYPVFRNSPFGQSIFAPFEHRPDALFVRLVDVLDAVFDATHYQVVERGRDAVVLYYERLHSIRALDVGLFEGVLNALDVPGRVLLRSASGVRAGYLRIEFDDDATRHG